MGQLENFLKVFISSYLILLLVTSGSAQITQSVVRVLVNTNYRCAGTLVRNNRVITAAHCVADVAATPASVTVTAQGSTTTPATPVTQAANLVTLAPNYNSNTREWDVAVIALGTEITGTGIGLAPMCTSSWNHNYSIQVFVWTLRPNAAGVNVPSTFNNFNMNVFGRIMCQNAWAQRRTINTNHMFCGYAIGGDICFRDRGGPVSVNGQFCGLISFGSLCSNQASPLVFINTGNLDILNFINPLLS